MSVLSGVTPGALSFASPTSMHVETARASKDAQPINPFPQGFSDLSCCYASLSLNSLYLPFKLSDPSIVNDEDSYHTRIYELTDDLAKELLILVPHETAHLDHFAHMGGSIRRLLLLVTLKSYESVARIAFTKDLALSIQPWLSIDYSRKLVDTLSEKIAPDEEALAIALAPIPLLRYEGKDKWHDSERHMHEVHDSKEKLARLARELHTDIYSTKFGPEFRQLSDALFDVVQRVGPEVAHVLTSSAEGVVSADQWEALLKTIGREDDVRYIRLLRNLVHFRPQREPGEYLQILLAALTQTLGLGRRSSLGFDAAVNLVFTLQRDLTDRGIFNRGDGGWVPSRSRTVAHGMTQVAAALQRRIDEHAGTRNADELRLWNAWTKSPGIMMPDIEIGNGETYALRRTTNTKRKMLLHSADIPANYLAYSDPDVNRASMIFGPVESPYAGLIPAPLVTLNMNVNEDVSSFEWGLLHGTTERVFLEGVAQQISARRGLVCPLKAGVAGGIFPQLSKQAPVGCCGLNGQIWNVWAAGCEVPEKARLADEFWEWSTWRVPSCPIPSSWHSRTQLQNFSRLAAQGAEFDFAGYLRASWGRRDISRAFWDDSFRVWKAGVVDLLEKLGEKAEWGAAE